MSQPVWFVYSIPEEIRGKLSFLVLKTHGTVRASGNFPRRDKRQLNDVRGLARGVNNTEFNKPRCSWRTRKSNIWLGRRLSSKARRASNFPDCSPVAYAAINRIWQLWLLAQWSCKVSATIRNPSFVRLVQMTKQRIDFFAQTFAQSSRKIVGKLRKSGKRNCRFLQRNECNEKKKKKNRELAKRFCNSELQAIKLRFNRYIFINDIRRANDKILPLYKEDNKACRSNFFSFAPQFSRVLF